MSTKNFLDHSKNETAILRAELSAYISASTSYPLHKLETTLLKVLANMSFGKDMSALFPEVIMVTQSKSVLIKKLAYHYLAAYAAKKPELSLLTINTLKKENKDPDATVRVISLRALSSLSVSEFGPLIVSSIKEAFADTDAYVRKTAVLCALDCGLFEHLKQVLFKHVSDPSPDVHLNALRVLQALGHFDTPMGKDVATYLVSRVRESNPPGVAFVLQLLQKYTPADEEALFELMDSLDAHLSAQSAAVFASTLSLFLRLATEFTNFRRDIYARVKEAAMAFLRKGCNQIACVSLLSVLAQICRDLSLGEHWRDFLPLNSDGPAVFRLKCQVLLACVDDSNLAAVLDELFARLKAALPKLGRGVVVADSNFFFSPNTLVLGGVFQKENASPVEVLLETLAQLAREFPEANKQVLESALTFFVLDSTQTNAALVALAVRLLRQAEEENTVLSLAAVVVPLVEPFLLTTPSFEHKEAAVWLACHFPDKLKDPLPLLEEVLQSVFAITPVHVVDFSRFIELLLNSFFRLLAVCPAKAVSFVVLLLERVQDLDSRFFLLKQVAQTYKQAARKRPEELLRFCNNAAKKPKETQRLSSVNSALEALLGKKLQQSRRCKNYEETHNEKPHLFTSLKLSNEKVVEERPSELVRIGSMQKEEFAEKWELLNFEFEEILTDIGYIQNETVSALLEENKITVVIAGTVEELFKFFAVVGVKNESEEEVDDILIELTMLQEDGAILLKTKSKDKMGCIKASKIIINKLKDTVYSV